MPCLQSPASSLQPPASEPSSLASGLRPPASSKPDVLVKVENVSKIFCRDFKKSLKYGVQDSLRDLFSPGNKDDQRVTEKRELRSGEFHAVNDVSFELRRGECLGLIGRNGAGKTTLLKMLNGLIKPDQGRIAMRGRIGALIALGAGFNPLLTGRENIYINGSVIGLSKGEIEDRLEAIISFAAIRDFIDAPVQSYSSGMQVRLGFAAATALIPDVLLVDEVLAVGDTNFKVKCFNRIKELLPRTAVILVSHNMFDIARVCNRILVMNQGRPHYLGAQEEGIHVYNRMNDEGGEIATSPQLVIHKSDRVSSVDDVELTSATEGLNTSVGLTCKLTAVVDLGEIRARFVFFDETQSAVAEWDSSLHGKNQVFRKGDHKIAYHFENLRLKSGSYRILFILTDTDNHGYHVIIDQGLAIEITNPATVGASYKV
jgi:lipopolysaccharide transport system ATP-binding protein